MSNSALTGQDSRPALFNDAWPWFYSDRREQLLANLDIPAEDRQYVEHFARNGYVIIDPEIDDFDDCAQTIIETLEYDRKFDKGRHVQEAWTFCEPVKRIATHPRILRLLRSIYQLDPIPFQTMNFRVGNPQRVHSDAIHLQTLPKGFLSAVWTALEDVDEGNGPLFCYPGSHRFPMLDLHELGLGMRSDEHELETDPSSEKLQPYRRYQTFLENLVAEEGLERKVLSVKKGSAIIWAANFLHGVSPLNTARTRHSQVTHYYYGKTVHYRPVSSDPLLNSYDIDDTVPNILTGQDIPNFYGGQEIDDWAAARSLGYLE